MRRVDRVLMAAAILILIAAGAVLALPVSAGVLRCGPAAMAAVGLTPTVESRPSTRGRDLSNVLPPVNDLRQSRGDRCAAAARSRAYVVAVLSVGALFAVAVVKVTSASSPPSS